VAYLRKLAALIRVEVDVVNIQRRGDKAGAVDAITYGVEAAILWRVVPAEIVERLELEVNANLVVLKSNERESQTRVAIEPELERNVQGVLRCA